MKAVQYTAGQGFSEIEVVPEWENGTFEEWRKRAGFAMGAFDGLDSNCLHGEGVRIYHAETALEWHAVVSVDDGDGCELVFVRTRADLLELRMKLIPFHALAVMRRFDMLVSIAEKAFTAWHDHEPSDACWNCSPGEMSLREAAAKPAGAKP